MADSDEAGGGVICPHCAAALEAPAAERPSVIDCPQCGEAVLLPGASGDVDGDENPSDEPDDLDGMRIRQVYQFRRSLYRARRYWLVGVGICVVAAGQILWKFLASPAGSVDMTPAQAIVFAVAFGIGGVYCLRRASQLSRAARESVLREPEHPPDLSSLSDGSQHWKNLEAMRGEEEHGNSS